MYFNAKLQKAGQFGFMKVQGHKRDLPVFEINFFVPQRNGNFRWLACKKPTNESSRDLCNKKACFGMRE